MKKVLSYVALSALVLAACTSDEVVDMKQDAIEFTASIENVTRADVTTSNLMGFVTWAFDTSDNSIFLNTTVTRTDASSEWKYSPTKFWPLETLELDFYSVAPNSVCNDVYSTVDKTQKSVDFESTGLNLNGTASQIENLDFCYAVNKGQEKSDGTVQVKFQHALSQIAFQVKNTNKDLRINVNSISIEGISSSGTYSMANANTAATTPVNGEWTNLGVRTSSNGYLGINKGRSVTEGMANHATFEYDNCITLEGVTTTPVSFVVTDADVTGSTYGAKKYTPKTETSLFLIPQTLIPGTFVKNTDTEDVTRSDAFLVVNCKIEQKNADSTWDYLWMDRDRQPAYQCFPVYLPLTAPNSNTWEEGKRYVYTIIFGEGGGYTEGGDEVLVPIDFTTEVKEFTDATPAPEVDAEVPEE